MSGLNVWATSRESNDGVIKEDLVIIKYKRQVLSV